MRRFLHRSGLLYFIPIGVKKELNARAVQPGKKRNPIKKEKTSPYKLY